MRQSAVNDLIAAARAKRHGMKHTIKIAQEARAAGIPYDLAYAMVEKETTNGSNVFGHDPTDAIPRSWQGSTVTQSKYETYRRNRRAGKGMQGVGPLQLTWWQTQDAADKLGGCWKPRYNLRQGFRTLKRNITIHGVHDGIRRYNGSGPKAEAYARDVLAKRVKWRKRLNP